MIESQPASNEPAPLFRYRTWATGHTPNVTRAVLSVEPGRLVVGRGWTKFLFDEIVHEGTEVEIFKARSEGWWNIPYLLVRDTNKYSLVRISRLSLGAISDSVRAAGFEVAIEEVPVVAMLYPRLLERHLRRNGTLADLQR